MPRPPPPQPTQQVMAERRLRPRLALPQIGDSTRTTNVERLADLSAKRSCFLSLSTPGVGSAQYSVSVDCMSIRVVVVPVSVCASTKAFAIIGSLINDCSSDLSIVENASSVGARYTAI